MASSDEGGPARGASPGEGGQRPLRKVRYCAVYDCTHNHKTHPHLAYFGFPSDKEKVKIWAEKIRRPDIVQDNGRVSSYYRVCEEHFCPGYVARNRTRRRLLRRAVPTRNLPHAGPHVLVADVAEPPPATLHFKDKTLVRSTLEVWEYVDQAPKPGKKKKSVPRPPPPAALPAVDGLFSERNRHLAPDTAQFVTLIARLQTARDNKDLCMQLLHSSPQAYCLLQASLGLPTVTALHSYCAPRLPNILDTINLLKTRVDRMTDIERHCTLSVHVIDARMLLYYNITSDRIFGFHEVDGVQKPCMATRAALVTARGLLTSWIQHLALCYLARDDETIYPWIEMIIGSLQRIGLQVHALVCDPTKPPPFQDVTPVQPFFFVGDAKIYLLYDPPRLMKNLLCEFMAYNFYFDKGSARWSHVVEYRRKERNKVMTLTPELTDASIKPEVVHRMQPRRAARILSRALATALTDRADRGVLADGARATASFIIKLNNLYDLLNSNTMKASSEFKKGLSQDPNQIGFLTYMKLFFKSFIMEDNIGFAKAVTKKVSDSWQVTIEAVLGLQKDIQPLRPYLLTRNLHMPDDVAESARRAAHPLVPSCHHIFTAFKKQFFHDMLQPNKIRSADLNGLLAMVVSDAAICPQSDPTEIHDVMPVKASDYRHLRLAKTRSVTLVAKHLLRATSRVHGDCQPAVGYAKSQPQPDFLQLVRNLDEALTSALREGVSSGGLLRELLLDVHVLDCALPCACFPLDYLKRLFFRLRLYGILKHNQKRFKNCADLEILSLE